MRGIAKPHSRLKPVLLRFRLLQINWLNWSILIQQGQGCFQNTPLLFDIMRLANRGSAFQFGECGAGWGGQARDTSIPTCQRGCDSF